MRSKTFASRAAKKGEAGQAMLFTVLALAVFLIGAIAFAIDMSNLWFSRQSAQTAADAACTAGAMDMLVGATNGSMPSTANFTAGTAFDCNSATTAAPCRYASFNGFSSSITQASANSGTFGDNVYVDFPSASSVNLTGLDLPGPSVTSYPLIRVHVSSNLHTWFAGMLGTSSQSAGATAICAVLQATSPIPILVLHPTMSGSLHMNGGGSISNPTCSSGPPCGNIVIAGGPSKSIQVNSASQTAVTAQNNPTINLCGGGSNYCGSTMGVWGSEPPITGFWSSTSICSPPNKSNGNCTGTQTSPMWNSPSPPVADPFALVAAPDIPSFAGASNPRPSIVCPQGMSLATCLASSNPNGNCPTGSSCVAYPGNGCPDPLGCYEYKPGHYGSGICVGSSCGLSKYTTAIFQPGIYYLDGQCKPGTPGALCELSGSCIRPSTANGDGSGGTIFYFNGANSIYVGASGGTCSGVNPFQTFTGIGSLANGVKCTTASQIPPNLAPVTTLSGSVLLAPCNGPDSSTGLCAPNCSVNNNVGYGDPLGTNDPFGEQRGILFFQNRSVNAGNNPQWSGGGSMLLAGSMYFHNLGTFGDQLNLIGNAGSSTYVLGDIIVDQLSVGGSGQVVMDLNPSAAYTTLKAALVK